MPLLLKLFLTFLKIGAVSFGGGYGMISLIREEVLSNGWATEEAFMNFIAVAESTPGPIAVNMATFIGSTTYEIGWLGGLVATLGVILPSFIIEVVIVLLLIFQVTISKLGNVKLLVIVCGNVIVFKI